MEIFDSIWSFVKIANITDIIDILIVAFAVYKIIEFVRETRVSQLLKGILFLLVAMYLSGFLHLNAVNYLLRNTMQLGFLALLIVFQPELRRALEQMGTGKIGKISFLGINTPTDFEQTLSTIDSVCNAAAKMSAQKVGALIVFERLTILQEIVKTGITLNARPSHELFMNIFYPKAPMHDGAVIIRNNLVMSAGCFLPLSQQTGINKELGTRHRAALGISESSDAVVVVVSEENGMISFTKNGILTRNVTIETLSTLLQKSLLDQDKQDKKLFGDFIFRKGRNE